MPASLSSQRTAPAVPGTLFQELAYISSTHLPSQHDLAQQLVTAKASSYSSSMVSNSEKMSKVAWFFMPDMSATYLLILSLCLGHMPKALCLRTLAGTSPTLMSFFKVPVFLKYCLRNTLSCSTIPNSFFSRSY